MNEENVRNIGNLESLVGVMDDQLYRGKLKE
jgi:hypothetical protein